MSDGGWYDIDEFVRETADAWIVVIDNEEFVMPKSQCELDDEAFPTSIRVPDWLAEKEGLL